jgi:hypothetical protein
LNNGRADPPPVPAMIISEVKQNAIRPPDKSDAILLSTVPVGTHHPIDHSNVAFRLLRDSFSTG